MIERETTNLVDLLRATYDPLVALFVPGLQALITAFVLSLAIGVYYRSWFSFFLAFSIGLATSWLFLLLRWFGLVARVERLIGLDYERELEPVEPARVRVELFEDNGRRATFADLQCSPEQLTSMAQSLIAGQSFSEGALSGRGAPFSRSEFRTLRDIFIRRGWAAWRDPDYPSQGVALTSPGHAVVKYLAETSTLPRISEPVDFDFEA